ncbi:UvrD-helicase domain-containing protein [Gemmatimonas sp.]|uniref:UvrD-helicase domain-containing protein n=1 Tax=Gemmatimonas sp. TaxID=1962908 RepID=UPI003562D777
MQIGVADSFTDGLARLGAEDERAASRTAFQLFDGDLGSKGLNYERLKAPKDKNFRSVRVNRDVRIIIHERDGLRTLCFVAHHDKAYEWASRRRMDIHPKTGSPQIVEVRETVQEIPIPVYIEAPPEDADGSEAPEKPKAPAVPEPLFTDITDDELLSFGVPEDWLPDVRAACDERSLEVLASHLPAEAFEALWELATGGTPTVPVHAEPGSNPFEHPDAQRRFLLVNTVEELQRALDFPWDKWTVFLHPEQRVFAKKEFNGPARVSGSAGTGKTVVALHRAAGLARRDPQARVLLTTFNEPLAAALRVKLQRLLDGENEVLERIVVEPLDTVALEIVGGAGELPQLASVDDIRELVALAASEVEENRFSEAFVESEWSDVVDQWQIGGWEEYRSVQRLGRKTGLGEPQRKELWAIFEQVAAGLDERRLVTMPQLYGTATGVVEDGSGGGFDFVVVDEAQDISVPQLRLLAAMAGSRPDGLFFAGDLGQRIFQTPFSWKSLGVDIRGRSKTLRVNYRTSHEIRRCADRLLPPQLSDVDGISESRGGTVSVFAGALPSIELVDSAAAEETLTAQWIKGLIDGGLEPGEIGTFVRSSDEIPRARAAVEAAGAKALLLDGTNDAGSGAVAVGIMELAKGLEFRAVAVIACDEGVVPSQSRIEQIGDYADLEDVWETERQLLYVACTRARDHLLVTGVTPGSEFIEDLVTER